MLNATSTRARLSTNTDQPQAAAQVDGDLPVAGGCLGKLHSNLIVDIFTTTALPVLPSPTAVVSTMVRRGGDNQIDRIGAEGDGGRFFVA